MEEDNQTPVPSYNYIPERNKEIPVGVKIISVWYYIQFSALLAFLIFALIRAIIKRDVTIDSSVISFLIFSFGCIFLSFSIGRGLWRGRNWAKITAIVFALIGLSFLLLALSMSSIVSNIVGNSSNELMGSTIIILIAIVINVLIAGYLLFSKKVKEVFK
jgi:hypothetical protein